MTLAIVALVAACMLAPEVRAQQTKRPPNILLIVSDDQGYADLGFIGANEIITPNLDRIAAEGAHFTSFYVTWPACTPSRGSLLTGRYPQRNGVYDMIRNEAPDYGHKYSAAEYAVTFERIGGMDTREVMIPAVLKPAGYASGIFGKWDLGVHRRYLPLQRGFDRFYGLVNTGIDYYTHERYGVPSMYRDNQLTTEDKGTYCTYLFEREALKFIRENHDRPFFCYVPFNAPHGASSLEPKIRGAAQAPEKYKKMYPELYAEAGYQERQRYGQPAMSPNSAKRRLEYVGAVTAMDDSIGKMLDLLDELAIADNTIVVFFADNGGGGGADNQPLRGHKGDMTEGGLRVSCVMKWPGVIPPGTVNNEFLTTLELLPTFAAAAGAPLPRGVILDGFDAREVLAGQQKSPRRELISQRKDSIGVRLGDWKWVSQGRHTGLYNLADDIGEQNDLSKQHPQILKQLQDRYAAWAREMEAAEPRGPFRDY